MFNNQQNTVGQLNQAETINSPVQGGDSQASLADVGKELAEVLERVYREHSPDVSAVGQMREAPQLFADIGAAIAHPSPEPEADKKEAEGLVARLKRICTSPKLGRSLACGLSSGLKAAASRSPVGAGVIAFLDEFAENEK